MFPSLSIAITFLLSPTSLHSQPVLFPLSSGQDSPPHSHTRRSHYFFSRSIAYFLALIRFSSTPHSHAVSSTSPQPQVVCKLLLSTLKQDYTVFLYLSIAYFPPLSYLQNSLNLSFPHSQLVPSFGPQQMQGSFLLHMHTKKVLLSSPLTIIAHFPPLPHTTQDSPLRHPHPDYLIFPTHDHSSRPSLTYTPRQHHSREVEEGS